MALPGLDGNHRLHWQPHFQLLMSITDYSGSQTSSSGWQSQATTLAATLPALDVCVVQQVQCNLGFVGVAIRQP